MVNTDYGYRLNQLSERISAVEDRLEKMADLNSENDDWDDATLQRKWNVCKRTTAYYRKQGLGFYKRGARIFYTAKHRTDFIKLQKGNG